jgi:hypothetical protein
MTRALQTIGLLSLLSLLAGCKEPGDKPNAAASSPTPVASAPAEIVFRGIYRSAWGDTVFTQAGSVVVARYPDGSLDCMASGVTLDCSWKEGSGFGKARLTKQASGSIQGTWGNAADDHDGGQWTFVPK